MFAQWLQKLPRIVVPAVLIFGLASGCSIGRSGLLDQRWGQSYRHTVKEMTVHPEPRAERAPALEGLDALTAEAVLENYKNGLDQSSDGGSPSFLLAPVGQ